MNRDKLSYIIERGEDYLYDLEALDETAAGYYRRVTATWSWPFNYCVAIYNDCLSSGALPSELN